MAKKKDDLVNTTDEILKSLISSIGGDVVSTGKSLIDTERKIIPFGPKLNTILGGGIPEGTLTLISGKPKQGKSSAILHFLKNCQQAGRHTWYFDVEARLKKMNVCGITGLDPDKLLWVRSTSGNLLTAEKILTDVTTILKDDPGAVIVIDSLSALIPEKEYAKDLSGSGRTELHKLLSVFYKQASTLLNINKGILIGVNHIIANHSAMPGSSPWIESGSIKGQYYSDIRLRIKYSKLWEEKEQVIGQQVNWVCDCSALGAPGGECESFFRFNTGIDVLYESILFAIDAGLIVKAGAWYSCPFIVNHGGEELKVQGEAKLYNAINNNPEYLAWLTQDLADLGINV